MKAQIAVVDDERRMAEVLAMVLRRAGHEVTAFHRPGDLLAACDAAGGGIPFDLVLTDLKMPEMDGVALLKALKERERALAGATGWSQVPVILITAHATVQTAVAAMREGAFDYLDKPVDNDVCRATVQRALAHTRLSRENRYLRAQLQSRYAPENAIAASPSMQAVFALAARAARSTATVLISGESGTGKELVARAVHFHSPRVGGPFVAVNCKALAAGVLESELFGHEKGAFTGAQGAHKGVFERAHGGTLLLDEIGEVDPSFQAKLLRVLQEGEVQPVGGRAPRPVDVRLVAATNKDLPAEVAAGNFRQDLYYRLAVVPLHLPPLRERPEDVLPLARHFLLRHNRRQGRDVRGWTPAVEQWLQAHHWPGNVRELENTLERGVVLTQANEIDMADLLLRPGLGPEDEPNPTAEGPLQEHLDQAAAVHIRQALERAGGVRVEAARALGVERTTLYRLMKKFGLDGA